MHQFIISYFSHFPKELAVFLIGAIPVTELRAALPLAYNFYAMGAFWSWFYAVAGTFFTMVIIVLALDPIAKILSKHIKIFERFFVWLFEHTRRKADKKMQKYGTWAIFILAASPIPFIGGMTGALAAFIFNVPLKKSLPLLLAGTMVSGAIVLGVTVYFG
ncbi:MAG: small multi-drug export protein [Parcubacteria group bacterium]